MPLKNTESFTKRVKKEINDIQHIRAQQSFRALSTTAEKVRFLGNLDIGPTAICHVLDLPESNVKRYLGNPRATSVPGRWYLDKAEEEWLVQIILTQEGEHNPLDRDRIANSAWEIGMKRDLQRRPQNKPGRTWVFR